MSVEKPPGVVRLGDRLARAMFALALGLAVLFVLNVLIPVVRDGSTLDFEIGVAAEALGGLPANAEPARIVPARVTVQDPTATQALALVLASVVPFALIVFVTGELRKIAGSVRRGDPFVTDNVRRLRWIGYACVVAGPVGQIVRHVFLSAAAGSAGVENTPMHIDVPGTLPLVGIGVLVLAHVFSQGVRLREDVEGTV